MNFEVELPEDMNADSILLLIAAVITWGHLYEVKVCLMCRLRNEAASREFAERQRINESRLQHSSNDEPKRQNRKSSYRRTYYCQENDEL